MIVATYLMCSTGIRFKDGHGVELRWLPEIPKVNGKMKISDARIRAEAVFKRVEKRMGNLVIVNSNLSSFEMIQAVVEIAEKYADKIEVIQPLLARLTFGLEQLAHPVVEQIPAKEVILFVTLMKEFCDFIVLRRDENFDLFVDVHEIYEREECYKTFPKFYDYYYPHSTVFLVHEDYHHLATDVRQKYRPERSFLKVFKRWDFMLFFGGLYRSVVNDKDFDQRYQMPNFTNGYEITVRAKNGPNYCHALLPKRTRVPCEMHGFDGPPQNMKIYYCAEFIQVFEGLIFDRRAATENFIKATGSAKQRIGYIDERGVPYATPRKEPLVAPKKNPAIEAEEKELTKNAYLQPGEPAQTLSPPPEIVPDKRVLPPRIMFLFRDNYYAVEVSQNGRNEFLKNSSGHEWTPMYLSMADGKPEIGEKAKNDYQRFPKRVIYDVLKIIGKPLKELRHDPKWGFSLTETDGIIYFQVETPSGPRRIPQEIVISAFLKAMKLSAESILDTQIKEIRLSSSFKLTESQKAIIEIAAGKNNLKMSYD